MEIAEKEGRGGLPGFDTDILNTFFSFFLSFFFPSPFFFFFFFLTEITAWLHREHTTAEITARLTGKIDTNLPAMEGLKEILKTAKDFKQIKST